MVTEPTATQNSPFLPPAVAEATASTHCTYPRMDGEAEWAWTAWMNTDDTGTLKSPKVSYPSTNQTKGSLTLLRCGKRKNSEALNKATTTTPNQPHYIKLHSSITKGICDLLTIYTRSALKTRNNQKKMPETIMQVKPITKCEPSCAPHNLPLFSVNIVYTQHLSSCKSGTCCTASPNWVSFGSS